MASPMFNQSGLTELELAGLSPAEAHSLIFVQRSIALYQPIEPRFTQDVEPLLHFEPCNS